MRKSQTNSGPQGRIMAQRKALISLFLAGFLTACGGANVESDYPDTYEGATQETGSLFDSFTLGWANNSKADETAEADAGAKVEGSTLPRGLGVNSYLWRAALDTISFMPLAATDPVGGVIATDWYNSPNVPNERVKINVVILGLELRADALSVSLFREKQINGRWSSVEGSLAAGRQLENIILTRARDFKVAAIAAEK
ncbi:DUF3576 domain-containing protein [Alphaproteobacteria bacterium]|nr:DUF3576 domain-containing protein [Alphaproteobacteria bacterium]